MASPGRGVRGNDSQATCSDFALTSTMGKSAQDVTISIIVTSATSRIGCPIAQKSSQLPVEKEVLSKGPSTHIRSEVLATYDPVQ